MRVSPGSEDPA